MSRVCFLILKIIKQSDHFLVFHVIALVILKDCFQSVCVCVCWGGGGGVSVCVSLCV